MAIELIPATKKEIAKAIDVPDVPELKENEKICTKCEQTKALNQFSLRSNPDAYVTLRSKYSAYCRDCWYADRTSWREENPERYIQQYTDYNNLNANKINNNVKKVYYELRVKAIQKLGGKCVYCTCDNYNFLEFNHINGGGGKEKKHSKIIGRSYLAALCRDILNDNRKDIELACSLCNKLHWLRLKFGKENVPFTIIWQANSDSVKVGP